jgi:hypothetical protein
VTGRGTLRTRWLREVWRTQRITDSVRVLLLRLGDGMDPRGIITTTRAELAQSLGRSERRITERVQRAIDAGLLDRVQAGQPAKGDTPATATTYAAVLPSQGADGRTLREGADSGISQGADGRTLSPAGSVLVRTGIEGADGGPALGKRESLSNDGYPGARVPQTKSAPTRTEAVPRPSCRRTGADHDRRRDRRHDPGPCPARRRPAPHPQATHSGHPRRAQPSSPLRQNPQQRRTIGAHTMSRAWSKGSTRAWRRLRAAVLANNQALHGGYCQLRTDVCTGLADTVHHTLGRAVTGDDPAYLLAACAACNSAVGQPGRRRPRPAPRSTTAQGYGHEHQQLRAQWKVRVDALGVDCARCGELIVPDPTHTGDGWHLDHADDRRTYLGPSHADCNLSAAKRERRR